MSTDARRVNMNQQKTGCFTCFILTTATGAFLSLPQGCGMACHNIELLLRTLEHSEMDSKPGYSTRPL
jgi:hypothetical protein